MKKRKGRGKENVRKSVMKENIRKRKGGRKKIRRIEKVEEKKM